ncbi:hypothetical protein [Ensifer sp. SSB1]|uniref:hypothetical protein n=1 Tax=Ensifer sp. SSB1 TaxID=2795385 RepID=UPI0025C394FF|nr:hypothetical protein [Ensifer sp. SSB1]
MADSETSRTLPAIERRKVAAENGGTGSLPQIIDRRNLLPVAARVLGARFAESDGQRKASGPTTVSEMWPRWYAFHLQRMRAAHLKQGLEREMLEQAGGLPVAELQTVDGPLMTRSFAEINRVTSRLNAEQLSCARAELRHRRKQWKEADKRLGYSAAVTRDHELAEQAGIYGRVMGITRPFSLIEVTAKLHCLIVMHDPGLKREGAPWPDLRTLLKELIRLEEMGEPKPCPGVGRPAEPISVRNLLDLATQYKDAAIKLGEGTCMSSQIPRRLLALHAIELYLDALLIAKGADHATVRGFRHDVEERARMALNAGLVLRKRTLAHLAALSASDEYGVIRYFSDPIPGLSQVNRVMATLDELSRKVRNLLRRPF